MTVEVLQELEQKYNNQKQKLEDLKDKQDHLMTDIEAWSFHRKQVEKDTQNQKTQLEQELEDTIRERSSLKENMELNEQKYVEQIDSIMQELDELREQITEKKRINKAFKIREEMLNFRVNPLKQDLEELKESKSIFEDNLVQLNEVYNQCYEEYQMSNEDKIGKMMSRVDLVAEAEEYEELIENLRNYYSQEEVDFILKRLDYDTSTVEEFSTMRVY